MKRIRPITLICVPIFGLLSALALTGCNDTEGSSQTVADNGITKARSNVAIGPDGLTTEQRNIKRRLEEDNKPGSVKHLYVISAYSGDVILYSTVKGKITSGSKRLTSSEVAVQADFGDTKGDLLVERLGDDGAYGSSGEYVFWWDARDAYHQHYVAGGQILHVSSTPMAWPKIILNLEEGR